MISLFVLKYRVLHQVQTLFGLLSIPKYAYNFLAIGLYGIEKLIFKMMKLDIGRQYLPLHAN